MRLHLAPQTGREPIVNNQLCAPPQLITINYDRGCCLEVISCNEGEFLKGNTQTPEGDKDAYWFIPEVYIC